MEEIVIDVAFIIISVAMAVYNFRYCKTHAFAGTPAAWIWVFSGVIWIIDFIGDCYLEYIL